MISCFLSLEEQTTTMKTNICKPDVQSRRIFPFQQDNRWGYFPSAAAAWRISSEPFMADTHLAG